MSSTVRRTLFDTPQRPAKRAKTTMVKGRKPQTMRIPKSLLPEMKQYRKTSLTSSATNIAASSIGVDMTQGDSGQEFIGSKFRARRLRVFYDFSQMSGFTSGIRAIVYIPKNPSFAVTTELVSAASVPDTHTYTILFDRIIPIDDSALVGTFDVSLNLPVELDTTGISVYKNDLRVFFRTNNQGATLRTNIGYALWYTDN